MVKQLVFAAPGVLQRLMAARKVTQSELASQIAIDVKTLRAVNRGEPVKEVTLKKIALKLGLPVEHLLNDTAVPEGNEQPHDNVSVEFDSHDHVLLKRTTAVVLKELLTDSAEILWSLDLPGLDPQAKNELLRFEKSVTTWYRQLRSELPLLGSLRDQIERLETASEIDRHIKTLSELSIGVFAGQYSRWARDEVMYYEDLWAVTYESTAITIVALRPTSVMTTKVSVDRGELPPKTFREFSIPVRINGHEVWNGRLQSPVPSFARELDDEVPF